MEDLKAYCKKIISRFAQFLYLTISNFTKNNLWESAAACTFGFIFSFIPITLIIFAVLAAMIRVYPNIYQFLIDLAQQIEEAANIMPLLDKLLEIRSIKSFNIFLVVWIIWMARKLFRSIIRSMNKVFRSVSKRKSWFNQALTFIFEFAITLIVALIILFAFAFSQIIQLPLIKSLLDGFQILFRRSSQNLGRLVLYLILFVSTTIAYRIIPGTKPLMRRCVFYAALSTASFFTVSFFINVFMNFTRYTTVYGPISSLVILMMKVYMFFNIFLFCAQMIYVSQFFEPLLRSEIYQLPPDNPQDIGNYLRHLLFINPAEIQTPENTVTLAAGETLYTAEQAAQSVFFIKSGTVSEETLLGAEQRPQGTFLGDVQCILSQPYGTTATAVEDCTLIRFTADEFKQIIRKSHYAALKAISKISQYTEEVYVGAKNQDALL